MLSKKINFSKIKFITESKIFKFIFSVSYIIIASEFFLRFFAPVPILPRYVTSTYYGIRGNMPNQSYWHKSEEYVVNIRTNSKGIRADNEIPYSKPKGIKRILVLGDSFGMGYEVSLEDTFTEKIKNYLKKSDINVEIVNLSSSGHGNAEELLVLRNEGLKYIPDIVLLCWHVTDFDDNIRSDLFTLHNGKLIPKSKTYLPGVKIRDILNNFYIYRWLENNSHLFSWIREFAGTNIKELLASIKSPEIEKKSDNASSGGKSYEKELTISILRKIKNDCLANNANLIILDIPARKSRKEFFSFFPNELLLNKNEFHIINPIKIFKDNSNKLLYWEKSHGHFTPVGCDLVGQLLTKYIIEHNLLIK